MADPWAGFTDQATTPQAVQAQPADPWAGFSDAGPDAKPEDKGTFLHPKRPTSEGGQYVWDRLKQYPGLVAGTVLDTLKAGPELMGDVVEGRVPATSKEGITRGMEAASVMTGASPAYRTGAQIAGRATGRLAAPELPNPAYVPPPSNFGMAGVASDLGAPLPAGLVSPNAGVQAATQAARQLPFVGQMIDEKVGNAVKAAGERVNNIAENLNRGDIPDRAVTGANTRSSLEGVIDRNNDAITSVYDNLRNQYIDSTKPGSMKNTRQALKGILRERYNAGMENPQSGLGDAIELVGEGRNFDGLVRARAQVGKMIGLAKNNPNPGFDVGDFKRLYGAMSSDMAGVVRSSVRPGVNPDQAVDALLNANSAAENLIGRNANIQRLLNIKSDESMVGSVINSARDKTGNARVLWELRNQMPKQDFEEIVGLGLSELGHNASNNQFSLAKFATEWNKMSDFAKGTLISDKGHRKALDDIASLGSFLKDADKYLNTSGTGRATSLSALVGAGAGAVATLDVKKILGVLGAAAGGGLVARVLSRPVTASSLRRWLEAYQSQARTPSLARKAVLAVATRNLLSNVGDMPEAAQGTAAGPARIQKEQSRATSTPFPPPRLQ